MPKLLGASGVLRGKIRGLRAVASRLDPKVRLLDVDVELLFERFCAAAKMVGGRDYLAAYFTPAEFKKIEDILAKRASQLAASKAGATAA